MNGMVQVYLVYIVPHRHRKVLDLLNKFHTYTEYFSVFDKSDPVQVQVMCSFGEQITNGQGIGALYVIVTRNG